MALTGELNDLSLAELIEFFCNQRKSGRLKISYECAPGYFFFQNGALADAKIGVLRGVEAVYYALTLENAQFKFSPSFPPDQRTINQPWAQVALEGLRRMDEGIAPTDAFPADAPFIFADEDADPIELEEAAPKLELVKSAAADEPFSLSEVIDHVDPVETPKPIESAVPLSLMVQANSGGRRKAAMFAAIAAILVIVAAIGVPAGWYGKRSVQAAAPPQVAQPEQADPATVADTTSTVPDESTPADSATSPLAATEIPKANHEAKDRAKQEEKARLERERAAAANSTAATPKPEPAKPGPKMVTVQVSFDENGRVTQASGADATATRIARQRRFPAGKAGTTTVTIPLN